MQNMENRLEYFEKIEANKKLGDILNYSRENYIPTMLRDTGKLLYKYVKNNKPENILEIGTAIGYSGIVMLIASDNKSHLITIEKNEERVMLAKNNFSMLNLSQNVDILQGDASLIINDIHSQMVMNGLIDKRILSNESGDFCKIDSYKTNEINSQDDKIMRNICKNKFDFIFLDGSKSQYIKQFDILMDMLNDGGVIFIDDALYMYNIYKESQVPHKHRAMIKNLRNFVIKILNYKNIDKTIYNYDEGIIVIKK